MKSRLLVVLVLMALALTSVAVGTAIAAYDVGYVWNRSADYDNGTVAGATTGNPNTDSQGNPIWRNESLQITGGLSDSTPWFKGDGALMNWNVNFQGGNYWAMGRNAEYDTYSRAPFIGKDYMYWNTYHSSASFGPPSSAAYAPAATWVSPVNGKVSISGTMQFTPYVYVNGTYMEWNLGNWTQVGTHSVTGVGGPAVVAKKSAADGTWTVLSSTNLGFTADYPDSAATVDWNLTGMDSIEVSAGDEIRFTFAPSDWAAFDIGNWAGNNWIWANEKSGAPMNITLKSKQYTIGQVWNRSADYDAGTVENETTGNPNTDSQGNAVWRNESLQITGGLSDPTPWFKGDGTLMNWNVGYEGGNDWAMGSNYPNANFTRSPFISKDYMYWQTYHSSYFGLSSAAYAPAATWVSPVAGKVSISGTMQFESYKYVNGTYPEYEFVTWTSQPRTVAGAGGPAVVAKKSAADGIWTVLSSANLVFPADYPGNVVDWNLTGLDNIDVSPGDQIRLTFMPSDWAAFDFGNWAGDNWIWANEKSGAPVNITLQEFVAPPPGPYNAGFIWNRPADYDAGTVADAQAGNPNTDSVGSPVWRNESLQITGGLSDPTPWYTGGGDLMNWNIGFQGTNDWARGKVEYNAWQVSPLITQASMSWNTIHGSASYAPSATWISPVTGNISIFGTFQFGSENYVLGSYMQWDTVNWVQIGNIDVDGVGGPAVIAKKSADDGTWTVLASSDVAFPAWDGNATFDWNLTGINNIDVSAGDQIRFTFIPSDWAAFDIGNWAGGNWMWASEKSGAPVNIRLNSATPTLTNTINYSDDVTVDGNLGDWANADWKPFDKVYDSAPVDIASDSAWAAKWGAGGTKVYVAVKVRDTAHSFTDAYTDWNARDAVELYLNTTGTDVGPHGTNVYGQYQEQAQQWALGIMSSDHNSVWATCGYPPAFGDYTPSAADLTAKGGVSGEWLYYEAALTPYEYFGGRRGHPSVVSLLHANDRIRADVCAVGRNATAYTGMKSSGHGSSSEAFSANYLYLAQHQLVRSGVKGTITLQDFGASTLGAEAKIVVTGAGGSETHNLVLDESGTYSFTTSHSGSCTAVASAPSYASQSKPVTVTSGEGSVSFVLSKQTAVAVSIGEAKKKTIGSGVILTGSITAVFAGSLYIEASDRSSGIRIDKASHGFVNGDVGKIVEVTGNVDKDSATQEIFIYADAISAPGATNVLLPLGLTNKATGGGNFVDIAGNGQIGVDQGTGLNNIGLLVCTAGWATAPTGDGFTLTDGSGVTLKVNITGGGGAYAGNYVTVSGISSIASGGVRVIKARTADDVVAATE